MIRFVVALPSEARPIVSLLHLKKQPEIDAFPVFSSSSYQLIVSGVGRINAAGATSFLLSITPSSSSDVWINIGIAGTASEKDHCIGTAVLADKVIDQSLGRFWYPQILFSSPIPTTTLITVDRPEKEFKTPGIYDMEGAAFCSIASRFSSFEFIHCIKIISDTKESGTSQINPTNVESLIENRLDSLQCLIEKISSLQQHLPDETKIESTLSSIVQHFRFSVTQQHQLKVALQRLEALNQPISQHNLDLLSYRDAKEILKALEERITKAPISF